MSDQVWQAGKVIVEIYWPFRGTREGRYSCLPVGTTSEFIKCSRRIPCLHSPEIHSRSGSCSGLGKLVFFTYGTFEDGPVRIMDSRDQVLGWKTVRLVKVLWRAPRSGGGNMGA